MKNAHRIPSLALSLSAVLMLAACDVEPKPSSTAGSGAAPAAGKEAPAAAKVDLKPVVQVPAGPYVEGEVQGGGRITGAALFAGAAVPVPAEIAIDTNVEHCGAKVKAENLLVDPASRGLKNVVVTVAGIAQGKKRSAAPLVVTNRSCAFQPHVSAAMVGSKVEVTNSDPILHTTHTYLGPSSFFNVPIQPSAAGVTRTLRAAGLVKLTCDVHKWMQGWIVVHQNPYFAVSGGDGRFEIGDVPPGTYTVTAWHEELGTRTAQVSVEGGKAAEVKFELGQASASSGAAAPAAASVPPPPAELPLGLDEEERKIPADNPLTPEKVELGKALYFDPRLSKDGTISCASCHDPKKGYSNGEAFATGVGGQVGGRSSPTVVNRVFSTLQFWDGRAATLEEQALGPIQNPIEMALTLEEAVAKLNGIAGYKPLFKKAFGSEEINPPRIAQAIASFERTIVSGDSPFDRHENGDASALSESQKRGLVLFRGKARCSVCHTGFNLTDEKYHNIGVGTKEAKPDAGRADITKNAAETGAFKTPTLREIALTAPYMHDGSEKTLEDVVEYYDKGGTPNPHLDKEIKPLGLTPQEKKDLVEVMKAFSGKLVMVEAPALPR